MSQITEVQEQILDHMPHFIAVNYQAMLDAPDDETCVQAGLATFDRCLRLLTIILASQYLIHDREKVSDHYLNKLLANQFPLGDMQSWRDVFLTTLKAYEGHPEWLFVPEVYYLYWDTSDSEKHRPRLEVEQTLDWLVALSNDWQSGRNRPADAPSWAALAHEVSVQVDEVLGRLAFLSNYELLRICEVSGTSYTAELHRDLEIKTVAFEHKGEPLQPNWYYLGKDRCDFLLLDPLLTSWHTEQGGTAIFRRLTTYNRLRYLLALTGELLTDETRLEEFLALMDTIDQVKQAIRKKEELTWLQITATAKEITATWMAAVAARFDRDLYLQRQDVLDPFKTFMASEARCFVLTGKSGAGKSNFVLSLQGEYKGEPDLCLLMVDAAQIGADKGLSAFISDEFRRRWGLRPEDMPNVWEEINRLRGMDQQTVLLVLDAVNENAQPRELLRHINELLLQPWKWLKVLITSRPEAWQRMCHGQRLAERLFFQPSVDAVAQPDERPYLSACDMEPFNWDELRMVYARYQKKFGFKTSYDDLSPEVCQLIREPLQLWMVASTYQDQAIPRALPAGELMENYISALIKTNRLYPEDVRLLQCELVPLLTPEPGQYTNVITAAALEEVGGNLLDRVFSKGYYSTGERVNEPFQRLADAQIVISRIQGMDSVVQFKYERFYDHFFGEFLFEQHIKPAPDITEACQRLIASIEDAAFLWGPVGTVLYLTMREDCIEVLEQLAVTNDTTTRQLIISTLSDFMAEDAERVRQLVHRMLGISAERDPDKRAAVMSAKAIALRAAMNLPDTDALERGLRDPDSRVRDSALKYAYFLGRDRPELVLELLESISRDIQPFGFIPSRQNIHTMFALLSLLLMDRSDADSIQGPVVQRLFDITRKALQRLTFTDSDWRHAIAGRWALPVIARVAMQLALNIVGTFSHDDSGYLITQNNLTEWKLFFTLPLEQRSPGLTLIPYIDRTVGSIDELEPLLLEATRMENTLTDKAVDWIVHVRGLTEPDRMLAVTNKIFDADVGNGTRRQSAAYLAFNFLKRQSAIKDEWLDTYRTYIRRTLDESQHGYGVAIGRKSGLHYRFYALWFYIALWNQKYPHQTVDLVDHYLKQAEETHDQDLLLYTIDCFSDQGRAQLQNYRVVLRSLSPYVPTSSRSPDAEVEEHLAGALAAIRAIQSDDVDHFLLEANATRAFKEQVRLRSYEQPMEYWYLRMTEVIISFLAYAPLPAVRTVIDFVGLAAKAKSLPDALHTLLANLLNIIGGS